MCRLYGLRSSHPTKVACELLEAQNALIRQSEEDERGLVNDDGWGIGLLVGDELRCEREVGPASESEEYWRSAADAEATLVIAHVRRGTVGSASLPNTHPFRRGRSMLAHNGHVGAFDRGVCEMMLAEMREEDREAIEGTTDSEHFFQLLLSRRDRSPGAPLTDVLADAIRDVHGMAAEVDPEAEVALNVLWSVEDRLVGSRLGRSLWHLERDGPHRCATCGEIHPPPDSIPEGEVYRSAEVASERITDEGWEEVPEGTVFRVDETFDLRFEPIGL